MLTLLSDAAEEAPIVCVVDDAQWLDRASAQALAFAARRIASEPVAMLFGVREPLLPGELVALPALPVGGLPDPEARALLLSELRAPLDEQVIDRIVAEARGNPLALRELGANGTPGRLAGGFAVLTGGPRHDDDLFRGRLEGLPPDAQQFLLLAAAEPLGDPVLLWSAAERLGLGHDAAAPAEAAGLLEVATWVRFHHPLVRSAVYRPASPEDRRRVHAALATVTDERADPDRHAWHRAQAASGPDEDVAVELARSADRARARGGMAAAAAFLARAVELTPDPDRRLDRALVAAESRLDAGEPDAALELLRSADPDTLDPLRAAHVERLRGRIAFAVQRGMDAPPLLSRAAQRLGKLDVRLARDTHLDALFAAVVVGSFDETAKAAAAALAAAPAPDPPSVADQLLDGVALILTGDRPAGTAMLKRALTHSPPEMLHSPPQIISVVCLELWDLEAYITILSRQVDHARADGALAVLPQTLGPLGTALIVKGRVRAAESMIEEAEALAAVTGMPAVYPRVHLAAIRGNATEARSVIDAFVADATVRGEGLLVSYARFAEAMLHNGLGDYAAALAAARDAQAPFGWGLALRELVEAAVHAGERDAAEEAFRKLRERTQTGGTDWALGIEASCAALLADGADADARHREALDHLERGGCGSELGRAELLYGEWLRREGQRREARAQLRAAYDRLSAMGADGFAERALRELRATGERARRRSPETADDLTPQELHIARLVGTGATSREVAAELFVSPRTVDAHLRNIFRKLDITSRRQLRGMALDESAPAAGV